MLNFLIIVLTWIVPGLLLFLYLLWIGKRFAPTHHQTDEVTPPSNSLQLVESDSFAGESLEPNRRDFEHDKLKQPSRASG